MRSGKPVQKFAILALGLLAFSSFAQANPWQEFEGTYGVLERKCPVFEWQEKCDLGTDRDVEILRFRVRRNSMNQLEAVLQRRDSGHSLVNGLKSLEPGVSGTDGWIRMIEVDSPAPGVAEARYRNHSEEQGITRHYRFRMEPAEQAGQFWLLVEHEMTSMKALLIRR